MIKPTDISKQQVIEAIEQMAVDIESNRDYLTELDSAIGDADHGINMARGFAAVHDKLPEMSDKCVGDILKTAGMVLVSTIGGASGPLYGTAFMYGGKAVTGEECLELEGTRKIISAAYDGVMKRGGADRGDKTMLDAMGPTMDYILSDEAAHDVEAGGWPAFWSSAADAARAGMESTVPIVAKKGRASFLGDRSVGHIDPGAASFAILVNSVATVARQGEQ